MQLFFKNLDIDMLNKVKQDGVGPVDNRPSTN